MATIERRLSKTGKVSFRVKVRIRGHKAATAKFDRISDAKKWAAETETEIRHGNYFKRIQGQQHTVAKLIDDYCEDILPTKKPKTQIGQKPQLEWWKKELGSYSLASIDRDLLNKCKNLLTTDGKRSRSPVTAKRYLAALSHVFTYGIKDKGWINDNPVRIISKAPESKGRVRWLNDKERSDLLEACEKNANIYLLPVVVLAISTGARKSEILELKWQNLDLEKGAMTLLDTKNGERRSIPIRGRALELLRKLPRRIDSPFVFPNEDGTGPNRFRPDWEAAVKEAKLNDFRFHDLRHSCASYLAMNGATPGEIAAVLGHKTLQMVKRYSHIGEQHTAGVIERMNAKIRP